MNKHWIMYYCRLALFVALFITTCLASPSHSFELIFLFGWLYEWHSGFMIRHKTIKTIDEIRTVLKFTKQKTVGQDLP